jgi:hypothetical protein
MATACIAQVAFGFEPKGKPVVALFDRPNASSDRGAILLKSIDTHLGLTTRLADALVDRRQPGKVRHQAVELLRQRVFGLACGYADCNDAGRLAEDPIHTLLVGRDPLDGRPWPRSRRSRASRRSSPFRTHGSGARRSATSAASVARTTSRTSGVPSSGSPTAMNCHGSESRGCRTGRSAREPEPSSTCPSRVVRPGREAARAPSRKHSRGPRPQARRYESRVEIHSVV